MWLKASLWIIASSVVADDLRLTFDIRLNIILFNLETSGLIDIGYFNGIILVSDIVN